MKVRPVERGDKIFGLRSPRFLMISLCTLGGGGGGGDHGDLIIDQVHHLPKPPVFGPEIMPHSEIQVRFIHGKRMRF